MKWVYLIITVLIELLPLTLGLFNTFPLLVGWYIVWGILSILLFLKRNKLSSQLKEIAHGLFWGTVTTTIILVVFLYFASQVPCV